MNNASEQSSRLPALLTGMIHPACFLGMLALSVACWFACPSFFKALGFADRLLAVPYAMAVLGMSEAFGGHLWAGMLFCFVLSDAAVLPLYPKSGLFGLPARVKRITAVPASAERDDALIDIAGDGKSGVGAMVRTGLCIIYAVFVFRGLVILPAAFAQKIPGMEVRLLWIDFAGYDTYLVLPAAVCIIQGVRIAMTFRKAAKSPSKYAYASAFFQSALLLAVCAASFRSAPLCLYVICAYAVGLASAAVGKGRKIHGGSIISESAGEPVVPEAGGKKGA